MVLPFIIYSLSISSHELGQLELEKIKDTC